MKKILFVLCVILCMLLTACGGNTYTEKTYFYMDTVVSVKIDSGKSECFDKCKNLLAELDSDLSRHNGGGLTATFNLSENGSIINSTLEDVIEIGEAVSERCDGAFSVYSGGLTELWSNSEAYPTEGEIALAIESVVPSELKENRFLEKKNENTKLEFGGIAKGYACDRLVGLLKEEGIVSGMVSFSSSIGVFGKNPDGNPWKIALKDPNDPQSIMGYLTLFDGFISVSGDYERFYEIEGKKYNHIIDTKTGVPVNNGVQCAVVISDSGAECDALSTAFMVMGHTLAEEKFGLSEDVKYLIVEGGQIYMNDGMKEVFSQN
ncbi:MAG: FAD:protein FMN transferase [Clostridia bacterium]|nr:FAD:protein FMN transferase [Clostridia bacterium]